MVLAWQGCKLTVLLLGLQQVGGRLGGVWSLALPWALHAVHIHVIRKHVKSKMRFCFHRPRLVPVSCLVGGIVGPGGHEKQNN